MEKPNTRRGLKRAAASEATAVAPAAVSSSAAAERSPVHASTRSSERKVKQQQQPLSSEASEESSSLQESQSAEGGHGDLQQPAKKQMRVSAADASSSPAPVASSATSKFKANTGLDPRSASATSSLSGGVSGPCTKLDSDSLSVVLSFLDMQDFLHAICVHKAWRITRTRKTAWSAQPLPTLVRSLQDGDDDRTRQLTVESAARLASLLENLALISMWRYVPNLLVSKCEQTIQHLSEFTDVIVPTLNDCCLSMDSITGIDEGFTKRLQALQLSSCRGSERFVLQLARFDQLRVLVIDCLPDPLALSKLQQLTYLGFTHNSRTSSLSGDHATVCLTVARWLSVNHQLRSLAIGQGSDLSAAAYAKALLKTATPACQTEGADLQSDADSDSESEADSPIIANLRPPLDQQQACRLTDLSVDICFSQSLIALGQHHKCSFLSFLPNLTRLQGVLPHLQLHFQPNPQPTQLPFQPANLQVLRLHIQSLSDLSALSPLRACTGLRRFQLSAESKLVQGRWSMSGYCELQPISAGLMRSLLVAWRTSIESIRLQSGIKIGYDAGHSKLWSALDQCTQLQCLELTLQANTPAKLFDTISCLPCFRILKLYRSQLEVAMPATLLKCMTASKSWTITQCRNQYGAAKSDILTSSKDACRL